ncbi:ABC transporter ATP-binding protein [Salinibacter ruber]|uniref:ABC transporter ATP-binding protein n=1 Tax=Salinibacter ruber TaxID=146919 RepID=UPI0023430447|nr:ABC transporter ATP-binding protein [Salinibacter ruber]
MRPLRKLFSLLTRDEKRHLSFLFVAVLFMAGLEVVSVASIMPFLSVASDPSAIQNNQYLQWAYEWGEFGSQRMFLIVLGLGSLAVLAVSNSFIVLTTWLLEKFIWGRNHSLSRRLLRSYLYQPYEYFLTRNTSTLGKNILEEVKEVTGGLFQPVLRGIAKAIVSLFILGFLLFLDPTVALLATVTLGLTYTGIYFLVRRWLNLAGTHRVESNSERYQVVNEAFGGIKEMKLRGKEEAFLRMYDPASKRYSWYQALYKVVQKAPRYLLEAVAFGGIILIAIYLIAVRSSVQQVIPVLGLYAFAGYRLMPSLQKAFHGLTSLHYNSAALSAIREDLQSNTQPSSSGVENDASPLILEEEIRLNDITFTYPEAESPAIYNLSIAIDAQSTVGFVGKTGSGKTTVIDLILGLLRPQSGEVSVDGSILSDENLDSWQKGIGYVPQHIFLSDDSIARNIAFGVPEEDIDRKRVKEAAQMAQIGNFIETELAEGFETNVGERGVKLSGGQRQRVGIARALYHDPTTLVFDEATSALDQNTEEEVMKSIHALGKDHTIIIIAHRLSTVQKADTIFRLSHGRLVGEGTYEELIGEPSERKAVTSA